jgi:subfamily B ATP-binding cassette protein MsbA
VPRFYDATEGRVTLDGIDIKELQLANLRQHMAAVSQQVMLFNDSIRNNIAYGKQGQATDSEIETAARAANAWDFIQDLPQGMDTQAGEDGVMLSGGQRQRIAIARALLKDAPILILDEATSALDTESERKIQDALESLMQNRTTLVVAHRLSTIENADKIVVMEKGAILEAGTHQELVAADGHYAHLYKLQFSEQNTNRG